MSKFFVDGIITNVLPVQSGVGKSSGKVWHKQTAVLQTSEQYPKSIAFDMFNDRIIPLQVGQSVHVQISIESREYQGRWFTNVNAISVEQAAPMGAPQPMPYPQAPVQAQAQQAYPQQAPQQTYQQAPQQAQALQVNNDLPF